MLGPQQFCAVCLYELHMKALAAAAALGLHRGSTMIMFCEIMCWLRCGLCCDYCVSQRRGCVMAALSQEGINVPAVLTAPRVFFQPLSSNLAYPEFSER